MGYQRVGGSEELEYVLCLREEAKTSRTAYDALCHIAARAVYLDPETPDHLCWLASDLMRGEIGKPPGKPRGTNASRDLAIRAAVARLRDDFEKLGRAPEPAGPGCRIEGRFLPRHGRTRPRGADGRPVDIHKRQADLVREEPAVVGDMADSSAGGMSGCMAWSTASRISAGVTGWPMLFLTDAIADTTAPRRFRRILPDRDPGGRQCTTRDSSRARRSATSSAFGSPRSTGGSGPDGSPPRCASARKGGALAPVGNHRLARVAGKGRVRGPAISRGPRHSGGISATPAC